MVFDKQTIDGNIQTNKILTTELSVLAADHEYFTFLNSNRFREENWGENIKYVSIRNMKTNVFYLLAYNVQSFTSRHYRISVSFIFQLSNLRNKILNNVEYEAFEFMC